MSPPNRSQVQCSLHGFTWLAREEMAEVSEDAVNQVVYPIPEPSGGSVWVDFWDGGCWWTDVDSWICAGFVIDLES